MFGRCCAAPPGAEDYAQLPPPPVSAVGKLGTRSAAPNKFGLIQNSEQDGGGLAHAEKYPVRRPSVPSEALRVRVPKHLKDLPAVSLRDDCPPVYDQGHLGSCTANAIGFAYEFNQHPDEPGEEKFVPSRLFIYYNERNMEKTIGDDAGAQISDGIKSVMTVGVCPETDWPYPQTKEAFTDGTITTEDGTTQVDPSKQPSEWPTWAQKPPSICYYMAGYHRAVHAHAVTQDRESLKAVLAQGHPICFGFAVFESLCEHTHPRHHNMNSDTSLRGCLCAQRDARSRQRRQRWVGQRRHRTMAGRVSAGCNRRRPSGRGWHREYSCLDLDTSASIFTTLDIPGCA